MNAERLPRELRTYRAWALAHQLPGGVRDEAFPLLAQRIMRRAVHAIAETQVMVDGAVAFKAILEAIAAAREEVLLEMYILRDDHVGAEVRAALAAAVQRGVHVYVLADAVGSLETDDTFWSGLEHDGATVRLFHRLRYWPFDALRRDHRKIIVIDRCVAFTGGMNIGEEYGSSIRRKRDAQHANWREAWRDTLVRMDGAVARELAAVFAEGWDRAQGPPLPGLEYISWADDDAPPMDARTDPAMSAITATWSARRWRTQVERAVARRLGARRDRRRGRRVRREAGDAMADGLSGALVLDSRPGRGQRELLAVLASLVGGARTRLWITTPYFAPPTRALRLMQAAARRGVDVRLLVPGTHTDNALVRHAAHGAYRALLNAGVRVFEYERAMLHSKTAVVDGYAGVIGSTNLDFRSFWLNAECNVLLFDEGAAAALERAFTDDCGRSTEITIPSWSTRSIRHQIGDWIARLFRWAL